MQEYQQTFRVRWNDLDANRHAANSAYANMGNDTRIGFMNHHGITQEWMARNHLGPVLLREEWHYLRELHYDERITVNVKLAGRSDDYHFLRFAHCLSKEDGSLAGYSEVTFVWIDMQTRKMADPPSLIVRAVDSLPKADYFSILSSEEIRLPARVLANKNRRSG